MPKCESAKRRAVSILRSSRVLSDSVWRIPMIFSWSSLTGKWVRPDLKSLSRTSGPISSVSRTKTI